MRRRRALGDPPGGVQRPGSAEAGEQVGVGRRVDRLGTGRLQPRVAQVEVALELVDEQQRAGEHRPGEEIDRVGLDARAGPGQVNQAEHLRSAGATQRAVERQMRHRTSPRRRRRAGDRLERLRPPPRVIAPLGHEQGGGYIRGLELLRLVPVTRIHVRQRSGEHLGRVGEALLAVQREPLGQGELGAPRSRVDHAHRVLEPRERAREAGRGLGLGELGEHVGIGVGLRLLGERSAQEPNGALGRPARHRIACRRAQRLHGARIGLGGRREQVRGNLLVRRPGRGQDHRRAAVGGRAVQRRHRRLDGGHDQRMHERERRAWIEQLAQPRARPRRERSAAWSGRSAARPVRPGRRRPAPPRRALPPALRPGAPQAGRAPRSAPTRAPARPAAPRCPRPAADARPRPARAAR